MTDHLTLYAYQEDGELFIYRCPICGSTGPEGSYCVFHSAPLGVYDWDGLKRERVLVPEVGEEREFKVWLKGRVEVAKYEWDASPSPEMRAVATAKLHAFEAARDHFTQQPAGVGADAGRKSEGMPVSADSDGNQQPLGGDANAVEQAGSASIRRDVAEGGSAQQGGSALAQLLGWVEETHLRRQRASEDESARSEFRAADRGAAVALEDVGVRIRLLLTQQSSGGQEGGVEEGADRDA